MKRIVALAILGTAATTAFGQGHVVFSNYLIQPYSQVAWDAGVAGVVGTAVMSPEVQLTFLYADGLGADPSTMVAGNSFAIDITKTYDPGAGLGGGGYYSAIFQSPQVGDYTVQIRASGNVTGIGDVSGNSVALNATTVSTALPAPFAPDGSGVGLVLTAGVIPEPTTFALAGLGAAALLVFRRRS